MLRGSRLSTARLAYGSIDSLFCRRGLKDRPPAARLAVDELSQSLTMPRATAAARLSISRRWRRRATAALLGRLWSNRCARQVKPRAAFSNVSRLLMLLGLGADHLGLLRARAVLALRRGRIEQTALVACAAACRPSPIAESDALPLGVTRSAVAAHRTSSGLDQCLYDALV